MNSKINYWAIIVFYFIAISCRYLTNVVGVFDFMESPYIKTLLTGIGPAIGAIVAFSLFHIKPTISLKGNYNTIQTPLLIYWLLPIVLISIIAYLQKGTVPWLSILVILIYGLLEEIGWRGFLYQQLKPLPLLVNIIIVATLWFVWHLNFELSLSNLLFYGILIFGSWGIGKVTDLTHSLIAISAFHSLNNFFSELDLLKIIVLTTLIMVWIVFVVVRGRMKKMGREENVKI